MSLTYGPTSLGTITDDGDIFIGLHPTKQITNLSIASGLNLKRGTCLAKKSLGTATTVTAGAVIGTGNGAITLAAPAYGTGVQAGIYKIIITEGTVDAVTAVPYSAGPPEVQQVEAVAGKVGVFVVERPDGTVEGTGKIGTAYNKEIKFTLADGAVNFIAGDIIEVTVAIEAGDGFCYMWDQNATDGLQNLLGVLGNDVDATNGSEKGFAYVSGEFNKQYLIATRTIQSGSYNGGSITIRGEV